MANITWDMHLKGLQPRDPTHDGATSGAPEPLPQPAGETSISFLAFDTDTADADQNIDALMNNWWGGNLSTYWTNPTLTFSFPDSASDYSYLPSGVTFSGAMNAAQQAVVRTTLGFYASVSNLAFTELAPGSADGNLRFVEGNGISTAFAFYPNSSESGGDAWFNTADYNAPAIGTYAFHTFVHEIGHALGLKHGHETDGPGAMTPDKDSMEYSVMTYRSYAGQDLTGLPFYTNEANSYAQSLMMYDIAAIQRFYGADFTTNGTNSVYTFSTTTGEMFINGVSQGVPSANKIFRTVWDGDGVDTYDLSNYTTNLNLDLTPGDYSDLAVGSNVQRAELNFGIAPDGSGGYLFDSQYEEYAQGHLYNALQYNGDPRSLIENAIGGSGNDIITGNQANNTLTGNGGNDTLNGGAGADTMIGGLGNDTYVVDNFGDVVTEQAGQGTDTVQTSLSFFSLATRPDVENLTFTNSANSLNAGVGNGLANVLTGTTGRDSLTGGGGNDTFNAGGGNDYLYIDRFDTSINAGSGFDAIFIQDSANFTLNVGATGAEWVYGWIGNNILNASTAATGVTMVGEAGADQLIGSAFNDYLYVDSLDTLIDAGAGTNDALFVYVGNGQLAVDTTINMATANAEWILGGAGNDTFTNAGRNVSVTLSGGDGGDYLTGGLANDYLYGNAGNDTFVVTSNTQFDALLDFANGLDHINVQALGLDNTSLQAIIDAGLDNGAGSTILDFGGGNQLFLYNVAKAQIDTGDFIV